MTGIIGKVWNVKGSSSKKSSNAQISDSSILESIIDNILANNQTQIDEYHNGKTNLFAFFVGQVMKETKGKANPKLVTDILKSKLD